VKWVEISGSIVIVFVFFFFKILYDTVGDGKKDYFNEEFKYIIGDYNNSDD
jgi:hypothetical protein